MPQHLQMYPSYTCAELLRYVAWMRQVPRREREAMIDRALGIVDLHGQRDVATKRLSGGMRQRLGLAQALVNRPKIVFLDEPTVGLDPKQRFQFRQYLQALTEECTVVLATHLVEDVAAFAQEVLLIDAGQVSYAGTLRAMCGAEADADITSQQIEQSYLRLVGLER
jgi:ABC-type multidrug transport system ATPase subunit